MRKNPYSVDSSLLVKFDLLPVFQVVTGAYYIYLCIAYYPNSGGIEYCNRYLNPSYLILYYLTLYGKKIAATEIARNSKIIRVFKNDENKINGLIRW